jgi:regulator of protease activity HflC (stomatin/prohibitin superfamily)
MAVAAVTGIVILVLGQQIWKWEVERVEVGPGQFLVRTHRWGADLPEDEIVAPDDTYKGVMLDVLPEGRHFLNPIFWSYEVKEMVNVPVGKCLVLTRKFGKRIPSDQILAGSTERGIVAAVLPPGSHRINPYAYSWQQVDAVEIRAGEVGVRVLKVGKEPKALPLDSKRSAYVVPEGYRGVQETPIPSGTYYINPYVETLAPVDIRSHRVEFADIQFPSRDGFTLKPHVVVEYALLALRAPEALVRLTDEGVLHQKDSTAEEQLQNEILQKVVLPHIRGYSRIEGSNFDAKDFVVAAPAEGQSQVVNNREVLQKALYEKVKPHCAELGIDVLAVTLADMELPAELLAQISARDVARAELEKNKVLLGQYKTQQQLAAKEALTEQAEKKVEAETRLVQAKTKMEQRKEVELLRLKQELANAQLRLDAAKKQAEATLTRGKAEAHVIELQNEAEVAGLRKAVQGFASAGMFAHYHMLQRLAPALSEIFASDDSEFAKIVSQYMTPPTAPAVAEKPKTAAGAGLATPTK